MLEAKPHHRLGRQLADVLLICSPYMQVSTHKDSHIAGLNISMVPSSRSLKASGYSFIRLASSQTRGNVFVGFF